MKLRHAHIAVRAEIEALARPLKARICSGEDDLGQYRFFDVIISHETGLKQSIRFASHQNDRMVHVLAERIDAVSDLAAALFAVGMTRENALSISTDQLGRPVRNAGEINERIAAMSASAGSGRDRLEIVSSQNRREPTMIALH